MLQRKPACFLRLQSPSWKARFHHPSASSCTRGALTRVYCTMQYVELPSDAPYLVSNRFSKRQQAMLPILPPISPFLYSVINLSLQVFAEACLAFTSCHTELPHKLVHVPTSCMPQYLLRRGAVHGKPAVLLDSVILARRSPVLIESCVVNA